jgi:SAM-dependent methyltransferase
MNLNCNRLAAYFPFSYYGILSGVIHKKALTILDIGCGRGESSAILNCRNNYRMVGLDGFKPYLDECEKKGVYQSLLLADVNQLPFKKKSVDIIVCLQVIEHLPKQKGLELLRYMEEIGREQIIISTPVGMNPQDEYDGNPLQEHNSFWLPNEFKELDYQVIVQGLRFLYGEKNRVEIFGPAAGFVSLLSCFLHPLIQFFPHQAAQMICVKNI